MRGWLAAKQSGLAFEELITPMFGADWEEQRAQRGLQPSLGRVPVLWDGENVIWDSLAIMEYFADRVGRDRFWPRDEGARGMARAVVAEMHSSFFGLRRECPMNVRARTSLEQISDETRADILRILGLWAEARARHGAGGPFLFGTFGAADIFYAPIVSRFITYGVSVPGFAESYMQALWEHPWMQEWIAASEAEEWVIAQYDMG